MHKDTGQTLFLWESNSVFSDTSSLLLKSKQLDLIIFFYLSRKPPFRSWWFAQLNEKFYFYLPSIVHISNFYLTLRQFISFWVNGDLLVVRSLMKFFFLKGVWSISVLIKLKVCFLVYSFFFFLVYLIRAMWTYLFTRLNRVEFELNIFF